MRSPKSSTRPAYMQRAAPPYNVVQDVHLEWLMPEQRPRSRIAVINDDTPFLTLMQELLEQFEGYEVKIHKEADEAYTFVRDWRPDLVILDIVMGHEESGWMVLQLLTLDPQTRPIPVIVCSAAVHSLQEHKDMLSRYGVGVLPKPFELEDLLRLIRQNLPQ